MVSSKKTKIICTISDLRCDVDFIKSLYLNGMNVVRINSAHATLEGAQRVVNNVRTVSHKIAILIDTKGPELRLTDVKSKFSLQEGSTVRIADDPAKECTPECLHTTYPTLSREVPVGARILIDDGSLELDVIAKEDAALVCKVMNDGVVSSHKSVNIPNVHINLPALTDKDRKFVHWAVDADIDFIAHSFVRSSADLLEIQRILDESKSPIKLISKIENQQGVDNLDDILSYCYGVMVATSELRFRRSVFLWYKRG